MLCVLIDEGTDGLGFAMPLRTGNKVKMPQPKKE